MFIPIAEFRPDIADMNSTYSDEVRNLLPADGSYMPMPSFSTFSAPLPDAPLGGISVRSLDGGIAIFAGTATKLYRLDNTGLSWIDVSPPPRNYSANEEARWSFATFGHYIIAVNKNDAPQVLQLGVDSHFRDLGGAPPRAGLVKIWGDFVCLMQLPDNPNRVHWSGLNDAEWWTVGSRNCDFQDFADGGIVQGSSETTNPLIFLQSAIYQASFVPGSDIIFSFQKLHEKRGCAHALSLVARGGQAFYADEGGFFQIAADGALRAIGFEKVDRSYFSQLGGAATMMMAALDPIALRLYLALDMGGQGVFNQMLVYDWALEKWSLIEVRLLGLLPIAQAGTTLEGLDSVSSRLEDLPFSLDSRVWQAGSPVLGAFSEDYRLGAFSGMSMAATLSTAEMGATDGTVQIMMSAYPLVDSDKGRLALGTRMRRREGETMRWRPESEASAYSGRIRLRGRGRFHKLRLSLPEGDGWHHIRGFDVALVPSGQR